MNIPPRKRQRLTYNGNDQHDEPQPTLSNPHQLKILSKFDDADEISDEDMDYEPDYASSFATDTLPDAGRLRSGKRRKSVSFTEDSSSAGRDVDMDNGGETSEEVFEVDDKDSVSDSKPHNDIIQAIVKSTIMRKRGAVTDKLNCSASVSSSSSSSSSGSCSSSSSSSSSSDSSDEDGSDSEEEDESATVSHESPEKSTEPKSSINKESELRSQSNADKKGSKSSNLFKEMRDIKGLSAPGPLQGVPRKQSAPGQGTRGTKMRNQRRKDNKRLQYLQKAGLLADFTISSKSSEEKPNNAALQKEDNSRLEVQRLKLLESIAASGVDIDHNLSRAPSVMTNGDRANKSDEGLVSKNGAAPSNNEKSIEVVPDDPPNEDDITTHETAGVTSLLKGLVSNAPDLKRPRSKIDIASSRRMVFGSLGLKNPKTKADEENLRAKLAESAVKGRVKKVPDSVEPDPDPAAAAGPDQSHQCVQSVHKLSDDRTGVDAWKSKIHLTAVECCEKGVVLSTPPFPFVQRWDPQQQFARGKKRKRKSQHYEEYQEYEEESQQYDQCKASDALNYDEAMEYPLNSQLDHHQITSQLLQEVIGRSQDDLPALPKDVSDLQSLTMEDIKPTAIIAFKQLEISQATHWQPSLSPHRTAIVNAFESESGLLHLTLAHRDQIGTQARYDDDGERIYGKFEMVDAYDDESRDADDNSKMDILFGDMTEPKLVRAASGFDANIRSQETAHGAQGLSQTAIIQDSVNPDEFVMVTADDGSHPPSADESQTGERAALYNTDSVELQAAQLSTSAHAGVSDQGSSNGIGAGVVFGTGAETQESQQSGLSSQSRACVEASA